MKRKNITIITNGFIVKYQKHPTYKNMWSWWIVCNNKKSETSLTTTDRMLSAIKYARTTGAEVMYFLATVTD